jgi:hypothetical protein
MKIAAGFVGRLLRIHVVWILTRDSHRQDQKRAQHQSFLAIHKLVLQRRDARVRLRLPLGERRAP